LLVPSDALAREASGRLGVEPARIRTVPNGVEPERFDRRPLGARARLAHWRRWLVEDPQGWDERGLPGTVAYGERDLDALRAGGSVLLYSGRFTAVKRLPLLIGAYARARERLRGPTALVLLGGYPGEYEGQHP